MTRLVWGSVGQRFYEAGNDRGVLYVPGLDGVAWNGLISVKESSTGGEPQPYYIDGIKYLNLAAAEEFEASISAFSAPEEFKVCDGTIAIHKGLFATQQPRRPFGLSYRTQLGNDLDGLEFGYKIHLVYNALAAPSERANKTLNNSVDPIVFSWQITTIPVLSSLFKPTAHFVIDTRHTPSYILTALEKVIYGSEGSSSRLPPIEELLALFEMDDPQDIFTENFEETF